MQRGGEVAMADGERQGRISELLRMRVLAAELLGGIDRRLEELGYAGEELGPGEADATQTVDSLTLQAIKRKFAQSGSPARVPLLRGRRGFIAELVEGGVGVDNLPTQPFLPWAVFQETVRLLVRKGGRAKRGDAMGPRLGDVRLPMDSVEGHVARVVYGKRRGDSVFRRITPIACILIWAGVCEAAPGELILQDLS